MSLGIWYCQLPLPSTTSTASTLPPRLRVTVAPGSLALQQRSGVRVRSSTWLAPVSLIRQIQRDGGDGVEQVWPVSLALLPAASWVSAWIVSRPSTSLPVTSPKLASQTKPGSTTVVVVRRLPS